MPLWSCCLEDLQKQLSPHDFALWIRPLQAKAANGTLFLYAPNKFVIEHVRKHYVALIKASLNKVCQDISLPELEFSVGTVKKDPIQPILKKVEKPPRLDESLHNALLNTFPSLDSQLTFDTFFVSECNKNAVSILKTVLNEPKQFASVAIHGASGLGKTHLLHALGNAWKSLNPEGRALYVPSEIFIQTMISAIRQNRMDHFKTFFRGTDLLLFDDIQFFKNKHRSQEELFHLFNALIPHKKIIVFVSSAAPNKLALKEALSSRIMGHMVVSIERPDFALKQRYINAKLAEFPNHIETSDAIDAFARRSTGNIRELDGALLRLIAAVKVQGKVLDDTFLSSFCDQEFPESAAFPSLSIDMIQTKVASHFSLSPQALRSSVRTQAINHIRQLSMLLSKELTTNSFSEIGKAFGGRNHTTVMHACRQIKLRMEKDQEFFFEVHRLKTQLIAALN